MSIKITIKGAARLERTLNALPRRGARRANRKATSAGATVLLRAVRAATPVDEGLLKKAQDRKIVGKDMSITAIVGANLERLKADSEAFGRTASGEPIRPYNIDHLVEFGHVTKGGKLVPPNGYMRKASGSAMPAAEQRFINKLDEEITREAMKAGA